MLRLAALLVCLAALPAAAQDGGPFTWVPVGEPVKPFEVVFQDDGTLLAATADLWRRPPGATAWEQIDLPNIASGGDTVLPLRGDTLIAGRFLSRSFDGGRTWDEPTCIADDYDTITCSRLDVKHSRAIAEITVGPFAGRLLAGGALYSDDRGASWQTATVVANETNWTLSMYAFAPLPSGRVLGAGNYGAAVSPDGGETWTPTDLFAPYGYSGLAVTPWATPGSVQAHQAGGPAPSCGLGDAALCEGAIWSGGAVGEAHSQMWWTNDGGRTWHFGSDLPQEIDGPGFPLVAVLAELDRDGQATDGSAGAGRGLVVLGRGFVFRTLDGGASWERVGRLPSMTDGVRIALSGEVGPDDRLYIGAPQLGTPLSPVLVSEEPASAALSYVVSASGAPERAALGVRVRPNPSAGGAIRVELTGDGAARGWVVDAVGRVVTELWAGELRGERTVELDVSAWAVGVYTVVVESAGARRAEVFTIAR